MSTAAVGKFLIPLASFGLGAVAMHLWRPLPSPAASVLSEKGKRDGNTVDGKTIHGENRPPPRNGRERGGPISDPPSNPSITLPWPTVDALVARTSFDQFISRLGLNGGQLASMRALRENSLAEFRNLEATHAKAVTRDGVRLVEIQPFAAEAESWVGSMGRSARGIVDEGTADLIARLIASEVNDGGAAAMRREIFIREAPDQKDRLLIEERLFDAQGRQVDSDYEIVNERSKSRWGQLLDFGP